MLPSVSLYVVSVTVLVLRHWHCGTELGRAALKSVELGSYRAQGRLALQKDVNSTHTQRKKGLWVLPKPNWRSSSAISYSLARSILAVCRWCLT